jgi:DoxX-like family
MGIYVEIPIRGSMDELWEKTQNPQLHQRWDLRFNQIEYLPREAGEPQKFLYRTRIGIGFTIDGNGESTGTRDGEGGARTSSLKFWSSDPKSLIKVGSGYWKYVPTETGIRFFTWYDYETRFSVFGRVIDACIFRPLLGWATAWSFDRLRLWIERGIPPEVSQDRALIYLVARGTMAFVWLYHGLVPKLLYHDAIELDLLSRIGTPGSRLHAAATVAGLVELFFSFLLVALWRHSWPLWLTLGLMLFGIPVVAITAPTYLSAAFNPLTLNLAVAALAAIAIIAGRDLTSAARCRRTPDKSE